MGLPRKSRKIVISGAAAAAVLVVLGTVFISGYFISPSLDQSGDRSSACAHFESRNRTIVISCSATLSEVSNTISNDGILKKESASGVWLLNSSIIVQKGAVLEIKNPEASWVKINGEGRSHEAKVIISSTEDAMEESPYSVVVFGALHLDGVKITSWNPSSSNFSYQKADGSVLRPYLRIERNADPSHILRSEIAYMGYNSSGTHGLSFYGGDGSTLVGNRIHDLWFGFYSMRVGNIRIDNNSIYNNLKYGIDPHTESHDITVTNNHIHNSRIGLICSLSCSNLLFQNNRIENNKEIGLMFSKNTTNSIAQYNTISSSDTGISVSESHSNRIYNNNVTRTSDGIALKSNSTDNMVAKNTVTNPSDCGILMTLAVHGNSIKSNEIRDYNESAICLSKAASDNLIFSNSVNGLGQYGIDIKDKNVLRNNFTANTIQLSSNAIRVYNNTGTIFVANKVGNSEGHQYIISGNANLTLLKTQFIGDRIRSAGNLSNTIAIQNSGVIDVTTERPGANDTTARYNTDTQPYIATLSAATIRLYSK